VTQLQLGIEVQQIDATWEVKTLHVFHYQLKDPRGSMPHFEDSRSHSDTPQPAGLLWTSDQPVAETPTHNTHSQKTFMPPAGFEPAIPASQRPQSHTFCIYIYKVKRSRYRPGVAQRVGSGIALFFHDRGTRRG
jgi:hypothetical protein